MTKGSGRENFVRGKKQQREFDDLNHPLCSTLVLSLPNLQQSFNIETDSSDYDVGIVLTHHGHPVAYHTETLSYTVHKYPTYEK